MLSHLGNPYYHHPQPSARQAADDVLLYITSRPDLAKLFEQGKMLGILRVELPSDTIASTHTRVHYNNNIAYLAAFSGVVNGLDDKERFFVPPVYDLQNPDDFYLQRDAEITAINCKINALTAIEPKDKLGSKSLRRQIEELRLQRRAMSIELQGEIFKHFNFCNASLEYRNIVDVFADAKRGLPPGGCGECAAPRLLQYAYEHHLRPLELMEFWYGRSPRNIQRIHGRAYPSCIEKCSPILSYMLPLAKAAEPSTQTTIESLPIIYEDEHLLCLVKPKDVLSTPAKDLSLPNVEMWLHQRYPAVHGPMLAHRLDQATSGLMLAAKDAQTHKLLQQQFEEKTIQKRYIASLNGQLYSNSGIISLPLTVNPDDRPRQVVDFQFGKTAVTYYEVIDRTDTHTMLALYPLTGRTHQLRVHCASEFGLGLPIMGDNLYDFFSPESHQALQLHAEQIIFTNPYTGQRQTIICKEHISSF